MSVFLWSLILLNNHRSPAELPGHRDALRSHPSLPTADERMPGARPRGTAGTGTSPDTLVCVCDVYGIQKITTLQNQHRRETTFLRRRLFRKLTHTGPASGFGGMGAHVPCSAPCRHHPGKLTPRRWADESWVSSHLLWPPHSLGPAPAASWLPTGFADSAFGDSVEPAWPTTDPGTADKPGLLTSPPTPGGQAAGGNTSLGCRALGIITVLLQFRAVVSNKRQHVRLKRPPGKPGRAWGGPTVRPGLRPRAWAATEVPPSLAFFCHSFMEIA